MMDESYDKSKGDPPPTYTDYSASGGGGNYTQTTTTATTTETTALGCHKEYITTIPGILKIVQAVCSIICLICAAVVGGAAAGWGAFVAGWALFTSLLWFFVYLFGIIHKVPVWRILIEWIYYLVITICFLVASIACAAFAGNPNGQPLGAYAFFGFIATIAFAIDLFLQFRVWRSEGHTTSHTTTTTATTVTHEVRY